MKAADLMRAKESLRQQHEQEFNVELWKLYMKHQDAHIIAMLEDRPPPRPSLLVRSAVSQALNFAAWAKQYDSTAATEGCEA